MRRALALFLAFLPLVALAQPDPYAPTPLVPGTFELTVYDDGERAVEGTAFFTAYPEALGGGWTLFLDSGTDLFAFERATPPDLSGADFGDARDPGDPGDVLAYIRLDDASAGAFSTGAAPPASPNRLAIAETDDDHTVGAFDFAAVRMMPDGSEGRLRVAGRFHALDQPERDDDDGAGGGDAEPPLSEGRDCPAVWDWVGGLRGGIGSWSGYLGRVEIGGPVQLVDGQAMGAVGWQVQLPNGCNPALPQFATTFGHTVTGLRAGIYRILNPATANRPPGMFEVVGGMGAYQNVPYFYVSGYVWITSISEERVNGTYSGYAAPPPNMAGPTLFTYGRFSARTMASIDYDNLPEGYELPEGVELPQGNGGN